MGPKYWNIYYERGTGMRSSRGIKPANLFGLVVFLLSLGGFLMSAFNLTGVQSFLPFKTAVLIGGLSIALMFYSIIYKTDFNGKSEL